MRSKISLAVRACPSLPEFIEVHPVYPLAASRGKHSRSKLRVVASRNRARRRRRAPRPARAPSPRTKAGSLRLPRCGTGARYGASVSTSSRSSGVMRAASRTASRLGEGQRCRRSSGGSPGPAPAAPPPVRRVKQCMMPVAAPVLRAAARACPSHASRVWITTGLPRFARRSATAGGRLRAAPPAGRSRSGSRGRSRRAPPPWDAAAAPAGARKFRASPWRRRADERRRWRR